MDKSQYLDVFTANRAAILNAAELGLSPPVEGCPAWNVGVLVGHTGGVFTFWLKWIRERPEAPSQEARTELMVERNTRLPGYDTWAESGFKLEALPDGVVDFARSTGDELEARLRDLDPSEPVWTFFQGDQTADFIQRRIAQETTIHRWDAETAHGIGSFIPAQLASDGIDEFLFRLMPATWPEQAEDYARRANDERFKLAVAEDESENWMVDFVTPRPVIRRAGDDSADVTVRGTSSNLLLYIYGRLDPDALVVDGNQDLASRWGHLAGRF